MLLLRVKISSNKKNNRDNKKIEWKEGFIEKILVGGL